MGADELTEAMAYYELEPWGEGRMDLRFAALIAVILNALRAKGESLIEPADLMPDFAGERAEKGVDLTQMTAAEVREFGRTLAGALGGG